MKEQIVQIFSQLQKPGNSLLLFKKIFEIYNLNQYNIGIKSYFSNLFINNLKKTHTRTFSTASLLVAICFVFATYAKCAVSYELSSSAFVIGETGSLTIISDKTNAQIANLPKIDGLEWQYGSQSSSEISIINGSYKKIIKNVYNFTIKKDKVTIPKLKIEEGNKTTFIGPFNLTAKKRVYQTKDSDGNIKNVEMSDLLFLKTELNNNNNNKEYYIGEVIPIQLKLFLKKGLKIANLSYPILNTENVIYKDYSDVNRKSAKYDNIRQGSISQKGEEYTVLVFKTQIRPITAINFNFSPTLNLSILSPKKQDRRRSYNNSFFGSSFFNEPQYNVDEHSVISNNISFTVKPLPEQKTKSLFLGLIGTWNIKYSLSDNEYKVGEPITLLLSIKGTGDLDSLKTPKLSINNFVVYEPEIEPKESTNPNFKETSIKYVLVPKMRGGQKLDLSFSTFSVKQKKYNINNFSQEIDVKGCDDYDKVKDMQSDFSGSITKKIKKKIHKDLLYLKKDIGHSVIIPLIYNKLNYIIFFMLLFPVILLFTLLKNRNLFAHNRLNRKILKQKKQLLQQLENSSENDIDNIFNNAVLPFLLNIYKLPLGSTANDIFEKTKNSELLEILKNIETINFMQGGGDKLNLQNKIINFIKKSSLVIIIFIGCQISAFGVDNPDSWDKALSLYDNGEFELALKEFKTLQTSDIHPNLLYNLGNCYYQLSEYSKALAYFEKAKRLNPRDSDITENINFIRQKLLLDETAQLTPPLLFLTQLRDFLRPDEWLFLASIILFGSAIIIIYRKKIGPYWKLFLISGYIKLFIAILAVVTQYSSTYDTSRAIANKNFQLYSLPSENSNLIDDNILNGESFSIQEERFEWIFIKNDRISGWTKENNFMKLFSKSVNF